MPEIAEQIVDLSQLLAKSIEGKTPSTVKYYRACISSFRKFLGNDTIDVTDFDENDLSRFATWLVDEKKSASTIKLYLMTLRAIFNNSVDDGNKAFANVSSKNDAETNLTTRDDILTVANASMSQYPALARVRDMFMFSFYTCGTSFECMKRMTLNDITDDYINIPDGRKIIRLSCMDRLLPDKKSDSNAPLFPLADTLDFDEYASRLGIVSRNLQLQRQLNPDSALNGWISCARECGIDLSVIAECVSNTQASIVQFADRRDMPVDRDDIDAAVRQVASSVCDIESHWYAMRMFSPVDTVLKQIESTAGIDVETYYPVEEVVKMQGKKRIVKTQPVIRNIIFLRATSEEVKSLSSNLFGTAAIYTSSNGTSREYAIIPEAEMMRFKWIISRCAEMTMLDEERRCHLAEGTRVRVTDGTFAGYEGLVIKEGRRYNLIVELLNLQFMVKAEIPATFLTVIP